MSMGKQNSKGQKHIITNKNKLLGRVRKIKGQLEGVEKSLGEDADCKKILHILASVRGALGGLMAEVMESHILEHIGEEKREPSVNEILMAQELVDSIKVFMK
ncbi:metal/formaldehyde-sensitive transcriptional repressor [Fluviispira sanaruensis]|uniref:Metal/formaldehyde-sensitive transcriptional repressor n=1 Tax=Fluviispira sanaruensis TaxID=2493639 RepID=A0A4P2VHJ6_FLUSA|nr:metal/formaldehyde-sensitive transcriptional repressor [Fluviispira sanaruensis]BBH52386.1 metal/formaldehyde-sensitive transcriptional repressor [Fluviispira sanaruensis]